MRIGIAADHAGQALKATVVEHLRERGHAVREYGPPPDPDDDYPLIVRVLADAILRGDVERGIFTCGSGIGPAVAANKIAGIRATVAHDTYTARQAVEHDDVNVICLGAWLIGPAIATQVLEEFLAASFSTDPDFRRRVQMLHDMEREMASETA